MDYTLRSNDKPLRDIILNHDDLLKHALEIGRSHIHAGNVRLKRGLLPRVRNNINFLQFAHSQITDYIQQSKDFVPAAEWFLDNYHLLKDLYKEIKKSLSYKYERQLPSLAAGTYQGYPRIYALMIEIIEHTDSQLNRESLQKFVNTYQSQVPLSSGELWAIPVMLRIILLENIRRLVEQILDTQKERQAAELWLAPFFQAEFSPEMWGEILEDSPKPQEFSPAYAERLLRRIRDLGTDGILILRWLDRVVEKQASTIEDLAKLEYQRQAMCQVSIGYAITSLRFLGEEDWPRFFEEVSLVEKVLAKDPSSIFNRMDFPSRDEYRHQIEKIARRFGVSEIAVARRILERAEQANGEEKSITSHVGYYLLGAGRPQLEQELEKEWGSMRRFWCQFRRFIRHNPAEIYFSGILLGIALFMMVYLSYAFTMSYNSPRQRLLIMAVILLPASTLAVPLVNWLVTQIKSPSFLPKLELQEGIPEELRTIVVIPTLLISVTRVKELLEQMEVYFLANRDDRLHFALLGDYTDAETEDLPTDAEILLAAIHGIKALNHKYGQDRFFLFHRKRQWNSTEHVWMGWERKRGKLLEFNRLLCQDGLTSYVTQVGNLSLLPKFRYVITLDTDTQLPRDIAKKLIGTMAHPLHSPHFSKDGKRVVEGYGILQPRISVSVLNAGASYFSRIFSGKTGVDPYTSAVSDVYQDFFGEGIFTGKGIYDIKVFHQVTVNTFPENTILSHDLIEGLYARTGLVTDIELVDGYPAKYHAFMRRLHRWVRGDWQIFPWLLRPLPAIARWKIMDNLRRSLEAPAQMLLILFAFTLLPGEPWVWISLVILNLLWPTVLNLLSRVLNKNQSNNNIVPDLRECLVQALFIFVFLPFQAYTQTDAIIRSLFRQYFTRQKMLEWETAAATERRLNLSFQTSLKLMWPSIAIILTFSGIIALTRPDAMGRFLPILVLWLSSPWVAYRISLPPRSHKQKITPEQQNRLRLYSRRIWAFFEEFVNSNENWLPPDNVQINPPNGVAHRTSPTNIGLALLANQAAQDLGYLTVIEMLNRIENILRTLEGLERWQGHFYNWYDTITLTPLQPLYISTVDSGNLVLYLLTLKAGLEEIRTKPVVSPQEIRGLKDTYTLFTASVKISPSNTNDVTILAPFREALISLANKPEFDLLSWYDLLGKWPNIPEDKITEESAYWLKGLEKMVLSFRQEAEELFPWLTDFEQRKFGLNEISQLIEGNPSLTELSAFYEQLSNDASPELKQISRQALATVNQRLQQISNLQDRLYALAMATDFRPLYDNHRHLFSIGYRVTDGSLDKSYYDLLASEARQASFIAVAKGDVPQSHWFRLGRSLTRAKGRRSLVSWSGTMFEFLMPLLVMRNYEGTLLDETYRSVVSVQKQYGWERRIPWGISESGYFAFDTQLNYQYKDFGVPGLGLKRGLIQDLVIAPYATYLSLLVAPQDAVQNLFAMEEMGFMGRYGLYEAIDYTGVRVANNRNYQVVQSFMAHHQGMSLLALNNVLNDNRMQSRFHANPMVQATELLLQERLPAQADIVTQPVEQKGMWEKEPVELHGQSFVTMTTADSLIPVTHFVSNGQYSVMLTNAGSGYSRWGDILISRWREDVTKDAWGMFFYIQNLNSGNIWPAAHQPFAETGRNYKVTYAPDRVEFSRRDGNIITKTEIIVSPEDPVEIRRISLTNQSQYDRTLEITSYFEMALAKLSDDLAHPAFSNLFIQTEFNQHALVASRRPRQANQSRLWLMHTVATEGEEIGTLQFETDRARFIGRGRNLNMPQALDLNQPLSNTTGAVLDPIMSLRQRVRVRPGQTVRISFVVGIAQSKEEVIQLGEKYRDPSAVNRAFELAWTHSQMELRHLQLTPALANAALNLGGQLLYLSPCRQEFAECIQNNQKGQSSLWPYAISGDLPIVLLRVQESNDLDLVRQLLTIHEYWRLKGLTADLVILNEDQSGYVQVFHQTLRDLVSVGYARELVNRPGGIFLLQKDNIPAEDVQLLCKVARVVFSGQGGSCSVQIRKKGKALNFTAREDNQANKPKEIKGKRQWPAPAEDTELNPVQLPGQLQYYNGLGGFSQDGKEYIIELREGMSTPLPWLNVIANPVFGFQVSESGAGYTWSLNSRENKLTPWSNDPILDPPGEVLYLRDEKSGEIWSPVPAPIREKEKYLIRHGQGYSVFEHESHNLKQELLMFVPVNAAVKIIKITLQNLANEKRFFTATYYAEWVLGVSRQQSAPYLITDYLADYDTLLVQNTFQEEFRGRIAFLSCSGGKLVSYTGDRTEFIGRNGDLSYPVALLEKSLTGTTGAGYDPCGALQVSITLEPGEVNSLYFLLGEAENRESMAELVQEYRQQERAEAAFHEVRDYWDDFLGRIQVHTPDKSLDLLFNRWLLYQTVVCRLWARSAFYQSGGAYGFRDQLQDVMTLAVTWPEMTKAQILRHCAHQFVEGDVQHWWHSEKEKGIRTKFSDDLLWLPFVTADYLEHTGDFTILTEQIPFLEDDLLGEDEDERYSIPRVSDTKGSVYEHCVRALERGIRFGEHGLPLIGTGDWNDGFSRVGRQGRGESIWLGWFLYLTLMRFIPVCERLNDGSRADHYRQIAENLKENIERYGWDGGWYRRAYFDDGTPIGSARNQECQIDAIAQSWAVLSGAAKPSRARDAMLALQNYLVRREEGILLLLTPPFDHSEPDPGYIRGYVPGVRENGGQYTHGALWAVLAHTHMGEGEKALELFQLLNPVNHARTESEVARYKAEPYVVAADVYAIPPHVGRGGWTWYTGAAGWMYQIALEGILGFHLNGDKLTINPCISKEWPGYSLEFRYKSSSYRITVENPDRKMTGVTEIRENGQVMPTNNMLLLDDGKRHEINVLM